MDGAQDITSYHPYWANRDGAAKFLPTSRAEMDALGWDSCDIIIVTGDAYVDHPSFGMAVMGRILEDQGFRVGIISQPAWDSADPYRTLGKPNLYFGVTAGNMDSMINRYTADLRIRHNDSYTPNDEGGKRPDRAVMIYTQRCKEAYKDVPIVIGGIEASLRRIAHYDYWSNKVRRSVLMDSKADILLFGNADRAIIELSHRIAAGEKAREITDIRGTAVMMSAPPKDHTILDMSDIDIGQVVIREPENPYTFGPDGKEGGDCKEKADPLTVKDTNYTADKAKSEAAPGDGVRVKKRLEPGEKAVVRLPDFTAVRDDPIQYAQASRVLHLESNPGNARPLIQKHDARWLYLAPPPIPLTTPEMDHVFGLTYARAPHPSYGDAKIPAWEMIKFSVNIMRGCFGGCTFCSITEHEGRVIQSRSKESIVKEIEDIRDKVDGFTGVISDLGGPTANMYRLACKDDDIQKSCRRLSCVYPTICRNLDTDHSSLIDLYKDAREIPGIKKILIASGLRYDIAVESPEYIRELVTHHVGGYLKIAPEHTEQGPLNKMMKPGMGTYDRFKEMFDEAAKAAGKKYYLIPYFIAAHPGTEDTDMMNLAIWLKANGFRADQVQTFYPSPMSLATSMYYSESDPLKPVRRDGKNPVTPIKGLRQRRLHKAFLRYHDPDNWPILREALTEMGREDLIGNGDEHLIPTWQPKGTGNKKGFKPKKREKHVSFRTQQAGEGRRKWRGKKP